MSDTPTPLQGDDFDIVTGSGEYLGGQEFLRAAGDGDRLLSRTSPTLACVRTRGGFDCYPLRQMEVL